MKVKVWVLSTCIPDECEPCWPQVFGSEDEAQAAFDKAMRSEWETNGDRDEETGDLLPYPDDPNVAHDRMANGTAGEWGRWELTSHEIEVKSAYKLTGHVHFNCCPKNEEPDWSRYRRLKVAGCRIDPDDEGHTLGGIPDNEATFWTVYGELKDGIGEHEAITDAQTLGDARFIARQLSCVSSLPIEL